MANKNPFKENKHEIIYHLINAGIASALVILGSFTTGEITLKGVCFGVVAGLIVLLSKFKEYWDGEATEYSKKIFSFVGGTL